MRTRSAMAVVLAVVVALTASGCAASVALKAAHPSKARSVVGSSSAGSVAVSPYNFTLGPHWLSDGITVSVRPAAGPPLTMLVDTGSNGVVIARSSLGTEYRSLSPRQFFTGFTYSSSGNSYSGEWVLASLSITSIADPAQRPATTVPMMIRAVDKQCDALQRCNQDAARLTVAMLGVGFDREQDGNAAKIDPHAGPGLNPFLQLTEMTAGTLPRSYLIGSGRLQLGVPGTAAMSTIALQRAATPTGTADWSAPQVCLAVTDSVPEQCGDLLLDTGLSYAIVQVPAGIAPKLGSATVAGGRPTMAAGQQVTFTMPALAGRVLYRFMVGGADAPLSVQWGHNVAAHGLHSFFNVSRFALTQVDYLFDASNGQVGFRWPG